jgi:hypothetical protein
MLSIPELTHDFGPNGAHKSSIQIAVDQRRHIGKSAKLLPNSVPFFKPMAAFVSPEVERIVRKVNSQIETRNGPRLRRNRAFLRVLNAGYGGCPTQLADRARSAVAESGA